MSLLSLVLTLRPCAEASLPAALGRAAHAALLRVIAESDIGLAQRLHDESMRRAFTCSSLFGSRPAGRVSPDMAYTLRYTALTAEVVEALERAFGQYPTITAPHTPHPAIELDGVLFAVEALTSDPTLHPWAARTTYEALAGPWLLGRQTPNARITLQLASPTAFKSRGRVQLLPLPELVFGSLLDKWNAFAPVALPEETRRFAAECLIASRFDLRTHAFPFKSEGTVKLGAEGTITFVALNHDRYRLSLINLLADFALFAGLGISTSLGMGQAKRAAL